MRLVAISLLLAASAVSADLSSLSSPERLESQRGRLTRDVDLVIAQEIQPFLTDPQARAFAGIQLDLPAIAGPAADPFDFYSAQPGHITLPLLTVAFVEELSEAYSWLWANRYSSQTVDEYLGMLCNRAPADFPGNHYPMPLSALHVPPGAMSNPAVARMAARVRGTTLSFMLLHEYGHLNYRTAVAESVSKREHADKEEELADAFALEVMKKNSEPPAGLLMLIHGMLYLPSQPPKDHPVSSHRLNAMADYLDLRVREFAAGRTDARLTAIAIGSLAGHIRKSALFLSDSTGQKLWAEDSRQVTIASLMPRRMAR
jgi:hypothetical protein